MNPRNAEHRTESTKDHPQQRAPPELENPSRSQEILAVASGALNDHRVDSEIAHQGQAGDQGNSCRYNTESFGKEEASHDQVGDQADSRLKRMRANCPGPCPQRPVS